MELYLKHRPKKLEDMVGQDAAIASLSSFIIHKRIPHAILLSGPSGTGKTTAARIVKKALGCHDRDFNEINAASSRGIDTIRDIQDHIGLSPWGGMCKIFLLDEAGVLAPYAQHALLKTLEETPPHVYFMLATTDSNKLLRTIRTRCTEIKFKPIALKELQKVVNIIAEKEGVELTPEVVGAIAERSDGSARQALVILNEVIKLDTEEEQLRVIESADAKRQAIELARALVNPRVKWSDVSKILQSVDEEPEQIRWMLLSYASAILLKGGPLAGRAAVIISVCRDNWYDSKKAGLILSCYEIVNAK